MSDQAPILILAIPLFSAFVISLVGGLHRTVAFGLLTGAMAGSLTMALVALGAVLQNDAPVHYQLGNWPPPIGIELVIDYLNGLVLVVVAGCALLTAVYSHHTAAREQGDRLHHYYTLFALLITGLLGMVATGDAFNLYVLLEISALSSYAMLATGRGHAYYATFKYLIMGTIGACFYLLGVGYLYIKTGTLNMADLFRLLNTPEMHASASIRVGFLLIIIGLWIKMAFFPLHGWLPNAYSRATTTTACLIAPLMTKVSVYIMIRLMFSVFSVDYVFRTIPWSRLVVWLASAAIIAGSISALAQRDLKRLLTAIIVAEIGYMVGGAWLANANGLTGAIYHILSDALMTLCLFMTVGAIILRTGSSSFSAVENLCRKMPVTAAVFLIGAAAIVGIPPTCGFFSKWYLIRGAVQAGAWHFIAALIFASLASAVVFFRLIEIAWSGTFDGHGHGTPPVARAEAPLAMLAPMVAVAALLVIVGLYTNEIVANLIRWAIPAGL
ncbi:MAG: monovalent cation/H+ antiporter subunit D family protein [Thermodesulfobacteriota bacterium]